MKILPIPNKPVADRDDPEGFLLPPHDRASYLSRHLPMVSRNRVEIRICTGVQDRAGNIVVTWSEDQGGWDD